MAAVRVILIARASHHLKNPRLPDDNVNVREASAVSQGLDTESDWVVPGQFELRANRVDSFKLELPAREMFPADRDYPSDVIELHESIAKLLAAQGEWELAYSHLRTALQVARDHECGTPKVPEQYRREVDALRRAHARALEESLRDELTSSYNRRYLDQRLVALLAERCGGDSGVAVALVDLDLFKTVNDTYGHLLGDRVLQRVVSLLQVGLPHGGFCARYGGEEFVLVLPDVDARTAVTMVERARVRIAEHAWDKLAPDLKVTISVGLVHHAADDATHALRSVRVAAERQLRRADDLLYSAKRAGRNVVAYRTKGAIRIAGLDDNCH